jgi:methylene-tetrahydromethanopterin dehydrogenase
MLSPADNVSPFDVNMAVDAGYGTVVPYSGVNRDNVVGFVQDAMFSRPPNSFASTGVFIGGHDVEEAAEMLARSKKAMFAPFELGLFADPNGAYTTAAALVALVRKHLDSKGIDGFADLDLAVFGGGPVGLCAAVLMAREGGRPRLVRLTRSASGETVERFGARYGVELANVPGQTDELKARALESAAVAITTAKAGVQVLTKALLDRAPRLAVVADVNAVPPTGIAGVEPNHSGDSLETAVASPRGIGALAIGKVKYDVQRGLFRRMIESDAAVSLDFADAYSLATALV